MTTKVITESTLFFKSDTSEIDVPASIKSYVESLECYLDEADIYHVTTFEGPWDASLVAVIEAECKQDTLETLADRAFNGQDWDIVLK